LLENTGEFMSAQDLHARLRTEGERVGLTTVYSQLKALADSGEVDTVRSDSGEALYRRCASGGHHHHLVCRRCGTAVEVDAPDIESWANEVGERHGFELTEHVIEISGVCRACRDR
jgi:Fur family ferric uptake transcriptional regulator